MPIMMLFAALGINYARQGVARQLSNPGNAKYGIDGTRDHCTKTSLRSNPWWKVYLNKVISVRVVIIQNRYNWHGK